MDEPKQIGQYKYPEQLPGQLYDANTQCKWQFGSKAKLCGLDFVKVSDRFTLMLVFTSRIFYTRCWRAKQEVENFVFSLLLLELQTIYSKDNV